MTAIDTEKLNSLAVSMLSAIPLASNSQQVAVTIVVDHTTVYTVVLNLFAIAENLEQPNDPTQRQSNKQP